MRKMLHTGWLSLLTIIVTSAAGPMPSHRSSTMASSPVTPQPGPARSNKATSSTIHQPLSGANRTVEAIDGEQNEMVADQLLDRCDR